MYENFYDYRDPREPGAITHNLGLQIMQNRQNDMEIQQLRDQQLQLVNQRFLQQRMDNLIQQTELPQPQETNEPYDRLDGLTGTQQAEQQMYGFEQQGAAQSIEVPLSFMEWDGVFEDLNNLNSWCNGLTGASLVGGTVMADWLGNNPLPEMRPLPESPSYQMTEDIQCDMDHGIVTIGYDESTAYVEPTVTIHVEETPVFAEPVTEISVEQQPSELPQETILPIEQPYQELRDILEQLQQEVDTPTERTIFEQLLDKLTELIGSFVRELKNFLGIESAEPNPDPEQIQESTGYADLAAEGIKAVFPQDVLNRWSDMPLEQREQYVRAYAGYLCSSLGVSINDIRLENLGEGAFGSYNSYYDVITINTMSLDDGNLHELGGLLDTVTHEMRHNLQHEAVENPDRFPDIPHDVIASWAVNFQDGNYILYSDDPRGYNEQPIEADAWSFAAETLRRANWQYGVDDFVN